MRIFAKSILIICTFLHFSYTYSQEALKLKNGSKINIKYNDLEYKSEKKLYFLNRNALYFITRDEFDYAINYWYVDTGKQLVKQNWSEIVAKKEVSETDYFELNRKGSRNITNGVLMVFIVPAAIGYGWLYLAPEVTELLYIGSLSTLIGAIKYFKGVKQKTVAEELANARHYEE